jgi:uncharacterized protein YecT (DUF1311 family)
MDRDLRAAFRTLLHQQIARQGPDLRPGFAAQRVIGDVHMKQRAHLAMAIAALATLCVPSRAMAQPPQTVCEDTVSQAVMNQCAEARHAAADKEMAAVYEQALAHYREQDRDIAQDDPRYAGAEALLVKSQAAWAESSNAFCSARTLSAQGGTMAVGERYACLAKLARNRTEDLRAILD